MKLQKRSQRIIGITTAAIVVACNVTVLLATKIDFMTDTAKSILSAFGIIFLAPTILILINLIATANKTHRKADH
jgi:hypothetical protein